MIKNAFILASLMVMPLFAHAKDAKSAAPAQSSTGFDHSHKLWNEILQKNIVELRGPKATALKYTSVNKGKLKKYINQSLAVELADFNKWTKQQKLAYFFNLYNALTVQLILKNYPVKSIKDIGSFWTNTWKKKFFKLFGKESYLDMIEHEYVRGSGQFNEPLVHFAFNCASIGCPALGKQAFQADKLEEQLQAATSSFLQDRKRNYYSSNSNTLHVSKIFDWYDEDFEKGWRGYKSLKDFFAQHAADLSDDPTIQEKIRAKQVDIKFNKYDWNLNEAK